MRKEILYGCEVNDASFPSYLFLGGFFGLFLFPPSPGQGVRGVV